MFATLGTQIMGSYLWPWAVACDGEVLQTDLYPKKKRKKEEVLQTGHNIVLQLTNFRADLFRII